MKRLYISDIVQIPDPDLGAYYAPAVAEYNVNYSVVYPPQNPDGTYSRSVCLVVVGTANHARLIADNRNRSLPDLPKSSRLDELPPNARAAMDAMLREHKFNVDWRASDEYGSMIRHVGRQLDPNFHERNFDVSE